MATLRQRVDEKWVYDPASGCKAWIGAKFMREGYGMIGIGGRIGHKKKHAHRVAWELDHGPIPDGLCVLHKCDNPPCVNTEHLFLGTRADNNRDKTEKGRCKVKLSPDQVLAIRADTRPLRVIGCEYSVSHRTIEVIQKGRTHRRFL